VITEGETLVLVFLVGTSPVQEETKISLTLLLENTTSSGSLGNPSKGLLVHYSWCSSSSFDSNGIVDIGGRSIFPVLDPSSSIETFFFNSSDNKR
jgi:hypothetical protein